MKIKMSETDQKIIAKHSASVRGRTLIELQIVDALIQAAQEAGYGLEIINLEKDYLYMMTPDDFKLAVFNLDDAGIDVYDSPKAKEPFGCIHLVFGNEGYDLISDYSANLKKFLEPVHAIAKFWGA